MRLSHGEQPCGPKATAGRPAFVRLWDAATGRALRSFRAGDGNPVSALAFSPGGKTLAVAGPAGSVRLWDWERGKSRRKALGHEAALVAFAPDGRSLASFGYERSGCAPSPPGT